MHICHSDHLIGYNGLRESSGNISLSLAELEECDWRIHQTPAV